MTCFGGTKCLFSKYSNPSKEHKALGRSSDSAMGLPCMQSSLRLDKVFSFSTSKGVEIRFLERSKISSMGQHADRFGGNSSRTLSVSMSSDNNGKLGKPLKAAELRPLSEMSKDDRRTGALRKLRLDKRFPDSSNSSNFPRPFRCSALTALSLFWLTSRTSKAPRLCKPSNELNSL
eukprot:Skav212253  [mRNA]  locus=scaffold499:165975:172124:+ [translate_table: standard]